MYSISTISFNIIKIICKGSKKIAKILTISDPMALVIATLGLFKNGARLV